jgi:broad specificity phosphatase PhoE
MDLTTNDGDFLSSTFSTLQVSALRDVPPTIELEPEFSGEMADQHWNALLTAAASTAAQPRQNVVTAHEMDLVEAASKRNLYDKILLLVKHGEDESQLVVGGSKSKTAGTNSDPGLTGRGVGQTLNVSRRVATFCNDETGLLPELVVSAPLRRAVDTAMLVFPNYTPESVRSIPWLCHPGLTDIDEHDDSETEHDVPTTAVDELGQQIGVDASLVQSKQELLRRSDDFVEWLRNRDEQVVVGKYSRKCHPSYLSARQVVLQSNMQLTRFCSFPLSYTLSPAVSSQSTWFQAFGYSLNYQGASTMLRNGELRAIGITFQ